MLKNILAVIGAVTVAAVAYVAFSDHKLTFDELVRKMNDEDDKPESKVEEVKIQDDSTETE